MGRLLTHLALLFALISSLHAYCPPFLRNQTACSCTDYVDGAIIKCNGPNGPLVVEELKKVQAEVRELTLENANIVEIGAKAFRNLRIKKLVLDNNRIKSIQKDAFRGLESVLQELSISHNRLNEVPTAALDGLRALNVLNLKCNRIGNISDMAFMNMPSLIELNLGCNKICKVDESAFKEVKTTMQNIILDNNCLESVPTKAIDGMQFLIALHMKYNKIEKLDKDELRNMSALSMLTLTGNSISHISKNFTQNTPSLRYIYMAENSISTLEPSTMKQFAHAEIIDLSHNNLPEITVDMFSGMENLQHLNLEANAIKDVAPGAFATTPLLLLWLPHNCLSAISPNMFQGAPFLKQVSLAYNNIRNIQAFSFAHLANLHTLDLSNNKIQTIQPSAIMGSDFLTVRVQENPLVCNQDGFHVMNGREAINLTTEANLICHTDYAHDVTDKCPRKLDRPMRPLCCYSAHKSENSKPSSTGASQSTTTQQEQMETSMSTESVTPTSTMAPETEEPSTESTPPAVTESRAAMRAKKLNMERFFRLSRRPPVDHGVAPNVKPTLTDAVVPAGAEGSKNAEVIINKSKPKDSAATPVEEMNQIQPSNEEGHKKPAKSAPAHTIEFIEKAKSVVDESRVDATSAMGEFNKDAAVQTVELMQKKGDGEQQMRKKS